MTLRLVGFKSPIILSPQPPSLFKQKNSCGVQELFVLMLFDYIFFGSTSIGATKKKKLIKAGSQLYEKIVQLKLEARDGKNERSGFERLLVVSNIGTTCP